jgi:hypothetical protein
MDYKHLKVNKQDKIVTVKHMTTKKAMNSAESVR